MLCLLLTDALSRLVCNDVNADCICVSNPKLSVCLLALQFFQGNDFWNTNVDYIHLLFYVNSDKRSSSSHTADVINISKVKISCFILCEEVIYYFCHFILRVLPMLILLLSNESRVGTVPYHFAILFNYGISDIMRTYKYP